MNADRVTIQDAGLGGAYVMTCLNTIFILVVERLWEIDTEELRELKNSGSLSGSVETQDSSIRIDNMALHSNIKQCKDNQNSRLLFAK